VNIVVLGSGVMGQAHARAFAKIPGVRVLGVSSRHLAKAQALASQVDALAATDDLALVHHPDADAVSITLPTHLHKQFTIAALRAGKPVLLEKPFALNVPECNAILAALKKSAAHKKNTTLMIAHVLRFWSEYVAVLELIDSGVLGKPRSAVAARLSTRPQWAQWFRDPALSGGAVLDLMIHDFDVLNALFGAPRKIFARGRKSKHGAWDHVNATIEYANASASVQGSVMMPRRFPFTMALKVLCERGAVEFTYRAGGAEIGTGSSSVVNVFTDDTAYVLDTPTYDAYEKQAEYFVECIRQNKKPQRGTPEQARLAIALANAARKSLDTDRAVTLKSIPVP
jgi:UDP-N-acetylglucosamine 3-dehydrogenase